MMEILAVGCGGFIGAVCRYLISLIPISEAFLFPIKTFLINIFGCVLIGLIAFWAMINDIENANLMLFLKVGICGGLTTFSTFALETGELIKNGHYMTALIYMLLSMLAGVFAVFVIQYFGSR